MALIIRALFLGLLAYFAARFLRNLLAKLSVSSPQSGHTGHQSHKRADNTNRDDQDPYHILSLSPKANQKEIKKAYKSLLAKYHPDKVSHLGQEIQEVAHRKTQDISWAYDQLS